MKSIFAKIKDICKSFFENIAKSARSRERLAVFICIPVTLISVVLCGVVLYGNEKPNESEQSTESEAITQADLIFDDVMQSNDSADELEFQSLEDGSCLVMGIGNFCGGELVIPEKNSRGERIIGIGNRAFEGCSHLVSVSIPASVTNIGSAVFKDCPSLVMISVDSENEKYSSSGGILYSKDKTRLICCPASRIGNNYLLNPNVRSIDDYAFDGIKNISNILYEKSTSAFETIRIGIGNDAFRALPITCNYSPSKQ